MGKISDIQETSETRKAGGCSCGSAGGAEKKKPINIFNEIAYLTEYMNDLGEEEIQKILDEFLAENG
ncbi:MAG: hypothetical protein IJ860_04420 [Eubacterium sp.]|nr:hypothetical protein [Eubacterium sp.]